VKHHVLVYLKAHNLTTADWIPCERCGKEATGGIHHIQPKGMGGRKNADTPDNLIALCAKSHRAIHDGGELCKAIYRR
jgi:hypothetical protein